MIVVCADLRVEAGCPAWWNLTNLPDGDMTAQVVTATGEPLTDFIVQPDDTAIELTAEQTAAFEIGVHAWIARIDGIPVAAGAFHVVPPSTPWHEPSPEVEREPEHEHDHERDGQA